MASELKLLKDPWFASVMVDRRQVHQGTNTIVIRLSNELNHSDSNFLKDVFHREFEAGNRSIVLDCTLVDMLFSVHVGIIWSSTRKFRSVKGDMRFVGFNDAVKAVLERLGLLKVVKTFDSIDDAIKSFM